MMKMVKPTSRRSSGHRRSRSRTPPYQTPYSRTCDDSDDTELVNPAGVQDAQGPSACSVLLYYALLSLKLGLWLAAAWVLSHLHLGLPCFLLPLTAWLYSGPMHSALGWAKRRARGPLT